MLIDRCSSGLLVLAKHLELIKPATTTTTNEAPAIIVSAVSFNHIRNKILSLGEAFMDFFYSMKRL